MLQPRTRRVPEGYDRSAYCEQIRAILREVIHSFALPVAYALLTWPQ
jgi:hypothetical protein